MQSTEAQEFVFVGGKIRFMFSCATSRLLVAQEYATPRPAGFLTVSQWSVCLAGGPVTPVSALSTHTHTPADAELSALFTSRWR